MSSNEISIGFSPCPNDTFIFDAMVNGRIDTEGIDFKPYLADVEELNRKAFAGDLDVTKLSFHAFLHLADKYLLLRSGSALGENCGPILIGKKKYEQNELANLKIGIPGKYTTANYLLNYAVKDVTNVEELVFSDIEQAVQNGSIDAGLIIHENRFTYESKGLIKIIDLGEYWSAQTNTPIPLGGIAVKRTIDRGVQLKINNVLKRSIEYAFDHSDVSMNYVREHAQEMDEVVMKQHIKLYVNDYTKDLGSKGEEAVNYMLNDARERGIIKLDNEAQLILAC